MKIDLTEKEALNFIKSTNIMLKIVSELEDIELKPIWKQELVSMIDKTADNKISLKDLISLRHLQSELYIFLRNHREKKYL